MAAAMSRIAPIRRTGERHRRLASIFVAPAKAGAQQFAEQITMLGFRLSPE
jgi:hypothetical protein